MTKLYISWKLATSDCSLFFILACLQLLVFILFKLLTNLSLLQAAYNLLRYEIFV
jgi:hypothetical protein